MNAANLLNRDAGNIIKPKSDCGGRSQINQGWMIAGAIINFSGNNYFKYVPYNDKTFFFI